MRKLIGIATAVALLPTPGTAQVLDFDQVGDWVSPGNFYNGGAGGGPNYGVTFFGSAFAVQSSGYDETITCSGTTGFPHGPSGCGGLLYNQYQGDESVPNILAGVNVARGFGTGLSLYYFPYKFDYTYDDAGSSLTVYSGLDGTGSVLATLPLPTPEFWWLPRTWQTVGTTFAGTARSIRFTHVGGLLIFDDVTLGSVTPGGHGHDTTPTQTAPEPASLALVGTGLGALGAAGRATARRRSR